MGKGKTVKCGITTVFNTEIKKGGEFGMTLKKVLSGKVAVEIDDKDFNKFKELCHKENIIVGNGTRNGNCYIVIGGKDFYGIGEFYKTDFLNSTKIITFDELLERMG